jgi:cation transport ATPase
VAGHGCDPLAEDGAQIEAPTSEVAVGDALLIRPASKVSVDAESV